MTDVNNLYMYTMDNHVTHKDQALLFNLNAFISAVGGNSGLFLGFSLLNTLLSLYNTVPFVIRWFNKVFC